MEIQTSDSNFLFLSVYMPFYNASKREECMLETVDALSMMETIIEDHPNHLVILGGDFNSELKNESPFDPLWNDFITPTIHTKSIEMSEVGGGGGSGGDVFFCLAI